MGGAEQFYADAKYKEAAEAAVVACRPNISADAICYICRNDASAQGLVSACGCHGGDGIAHLTCLARMAEMAVREIEETGGGAGANTWHTCSVCGQNHYGKVMVALGWACWKTYLGRPETDERRPTVLGILGAALRREDPKLALTVHATELSTLQRFWPHASVLTIQENMAGCHSELKQDDEALRILRVAFDGRLREFGPNHKRTIHAAVNFVVVLLMNGQLAEAAQIARHYHGVAREKLGARHPLTIAHANNVGLIASMDPAAARTDLLEVAAMLEDTLKTARHVYGPRHPRTTALEKKLADVRQRLA